MTGIRSRELEQAVLSVFIGSQPIGQKIQTQDIMRLIASTKLDKIELETALNRWVEASWFLDEAEVDSSQIRPDGTRTLPANWRLGNRPNLRQMHDDACSNRISDARVEEELLEHIRKYRQLTNGASAAGARRTRSRSIPGTLPTMASSTTPSWARRRRRIPASQAR